MDDAELRAHEVDRRGPFGYQTTTRPRGTLKKRFVEHQEVAGWSLTFGT